MKQITKVRETLADKAYQTIIDAVVTLEFKPGQFIYETEIANLLGVSRTPVREAFSRLKSEEMIEIFSQKGIQIKLISQKKVKEVRFVRETLEISAFKEVARRWKPASPVCRELEDKVNTILLEEEAALENNDLISFYKSDDLYHSEIIACINNETLMNIISKLRIHLNRMRYLELLESKHMKSVLEEHKDIFQALAAADEVKIEKLLVEHYRKFQLDRSSINYPQYFTD